MIDMEDCIFLMEFSVQYVVLKYCTDPWGMHHVTYLPTFCSQLLLDGDPGETSMKFATKLGQWGISLPKNLRFSGSC
jgi:hypothetical protein